MSEAARRAGASRTAQYMALFRALETARPVDRRLFEDPFARRFLAGGLAFLARLALLPGLRDLVPWIVDRRVPGARSSAVARTRFIDDAIAAFLERKPEQLVLLGSGLDARAYRLPGLRGLIVFEVDRPETLRAKRQLVASALGSLPAHVRFVPTDFEQLDLESAMAEAGYRESARTCFLWEGVTNYLTPAGVDATLRWCARSAPGSQLIFTYVHRRVLTDPGAFRGTARLFASLAKFGETWSFGLEPGELPGFLAERGLLLERDLGAAEYRAIAFGEAARGLRGYEFYRIALARVGGPAA